VTAGARTVLVTGAGRGVGRATALALAAAGYELVLVSKSADALGATAELCSAQTRTTSLPLDVRLEQDVRKLGSALEPVANLHAVVNNAGIGSFNPIERVTQEEWDDQLATNLRGAFFVIRETLPILRRQGAGLHVNIGSELSLVGKVDRSAYVASKFGLVGLTNAMRAEIADSGVHASIVYLGHTDSSFRGHEPGDRPGALPPSVAAEAIFYVIDLYPRGVVAELCVLPPKDQLTGPRSLL
jgi:NAD(P)-dependent dehydrogenase (short-subunit alcohol dehydrogenase family)